MSIFGVFILTTAIGVSRGPASNTNKAIEAIGKASYKHFGVDKHVKRIEKKYIPKYIRKHGEWIAITTKIMTEKKISYTWTF